MPPGLLRGEARSLLARQLEHRADLDPPTLGVLHRVAAGEGGIEVPQPQGVARAAAAAGGGHRLPRLPVPEIEDLLRIGFLLVVRGLGPHVAGPQELAVVPAHQEGEIGLLLDERRLVQLLLEDRMNQGHRQEGIVTRLDGDPLIGMDGGGVVVRSDGDHLGLVVAALPDVVGVRDAGGVGVDAPEHDVVHLEPGIGGDADVGDPVGQGGAGEHVAHGAGWVQPDGPEQGAQPQGAGAAPLGHNAGAGVEHQAPGSFPDQGAHHPLGDVGEGLVPGHPLPPARAALAGALQRIAQAILLVHGLRMDGALVATAGIGVRDLPAHGRIRPELLLADDSAVLGVYLPGAVALAVDAMEGEAPGIPPAVLELPAVEILPAPVRIASRQGIPDTDHLSRDRAGDPCLEDPDPRAGILEEVPALHGHCPLVEGRGRDSAGGTSARPLRPCPAPVGNGWLSARARIDLGVTAPPPADPLSHGWQTPGSSRWIPGPCRRSSPVGRQGRRPGRRGSGNGR